MENSKSAWLSLWYGAFLHMLFVMKYLPLRMTQIHFFNLEKDSTRATECAGSLLDMEN